MSWRFGDMSIEAFLRDYLKPVRDAQLSDHSVPLPKCNNVVTDSKMSPFFPLSRRALIRMYPNAESTEKFGAVMVRKSPPMATDSIWPEPRGSMVNTGCKSTLEALEDCQNFRAPLWYDDMAPDFHSFSINNRVYSINMGFLLKTEKALDHLGDVFFIFEDDVFTGRFGYDWKHNVVYLIFNSGRCVIMSSGSEATVAGRSRYMYEALKENYADWDRTYQLYGPKNIPPAALAEVRSKIKQRREAPAEEATPSAAAAQPPKKRGEHLSGQKKLKAVWRAIEGCRNPDEARAAIRASKASQAKPAAAKASAKKQAKEPPKRPSSTSADGAFKKPLPVLKRAKTS